MGKQAKSLAIFLMAVLVACTAAGAFVLAPKAFAESSSSESAASPEANSEEHAQGDGVVLKVSASPTECHAGDIVTVSLSLDGVSAVTGGVNAIQSAVYYDAKFFEPISGESFTSLGGWRSVTYNAGTGKFTTVREQPVTDSCELAAIQLKVKSDAPAGVSQVRIFGTTTSGSTGELRVPEVGVDIEIVKTADSVAAAPESETSTVGSVQLSTENGSTELANTGDAENATPATNANPMLITIAVFAGVVLILIIAFVIYLRKRRGRVGKGAVACIVIVLAAGLFAGGAFANTQMTKGDVDQDGRVSFDDVEKLQLSITGIEQLQGSARDRADMNSDGKLTAIDLMLQTQRLNNETDYEAQLSAITVSSEVVNKGENITVAFMGKVSPEEVITSAEIDGNEVPVSFDEITKKYIAEVSVGEEGGSKVMNITKVGLRNGKSAPTDANFNFEVLKSVPVFENYRVEYDDSNLTARMKFDLTDPDKAVKGTDIYVAHSNGLRSPFNFVAVSGSNEINVPVDEGATYNVSMRANYELSENHNDPQFTGTATSEKQLALIRNLNWNMESVRLGVDAPEGQTAEFEKSSAVPVIINGATTGAFEPAAATISGKQYDLSKVADNQFVANMSDLESAGKQTLNVEAVTLANGKQFQQEQNNAVQVNVLKSMPAIRDFTYEEVLAGAGNAPSGTLKMNFEIEDGDGAIKSARVRLYDENGNQLGNELQLPDDSTNTHIAMDTLMARSATARVLASIDRGSAAGAQENVELAVQPVSVLPKAAVTTANFDRIYIEKAGNAQGTFSVNSNKPEDITAVRVNSIDYPVQKIGDNSYQFSYIAPQKAGMVNAALSKVVFADNTSAPVDYTLFIEVLKSAPTVSDMQMKYTPLDGAEGSASESSSSSSSSSEPSESGVQPTTSAAKPTKMGGTLTYTFKLNDPDSALTPGKNNISAEGVLRRAGTASEMARTKVYSGTNTINFTVNSPDNSEFCIVVNYDRDSDEMNSQTGTDENELADQILAVL